MKPSDSQTSDSATSETFQSGRAPLYISLANALEKDIDKGRYAVGSSLPTETELMLRYGVSRHTVRQALRELKEQGLILSRAGIGTKVRARPETPRFFNGINSISELLQFVDATEMHVMSREEIITTDEQADQFKCQPGQAWLEANIVRKMPGRRPPLSYLQAYLRPEYGDALGTDKILKKPIYSLIQEKYGVRIVEVLQEITAANLTGQMARALKAVEGQAALKITRYYLDANGLIVEIGVGHYPSGRYTQRSKFRMQTVKD